MTSQPSPLKLTLTPPQPLDLCSVVFARIGADELPENYERDAYIETVSLSWLTVRLIDDSSLMTFPYSYPGG